MPRLDPDALLEALKAGHFYASQGPVIHDLVIDDEAIEVVCSPVRTVAALGTGSTASYEMGDGLTRVRLPMNQLAESSCIRISVTDRHGQRAWTNPIFRAG